MRSSKARAFRTQFGLPNNASSARDFSLSVAMRPSLVLEPLERRLMLTVPAVVSIDRTSPSGSDTNASSVSYTVTFNESVTNVAAGDFQVTTTGYVTETTPVGVTGSGSVYTVTVSGIQGNGTLRLDLIDNDSIVDGSSTPLGGTGAGNGNFQGQTYTIDQANPYILSIDRANPTEATTNASSVSYTVTFSERVTGVDPTDFTLPRTGTIGSTLMQITPVSGSVYTVTIDGITGTGTLGLNLVNDGSIHDLAGNALLGALFQDQVTYATGSDPYSLVVADFNRDGKPDISVANRTSNTVGVLTGIGDGTLNSQTALSVGTNPVSVVAGDVNGDGKPDLVVSNAGDDTISVLLGNGNGTFQTQMTTSLAFDPYSIRLADLNADGKPDLIVTNSGGNYVSVLLGNGDGTFQSATSYTTGGGPASVAVADVNGDGLPDLVVANAASNTLSVLLGNGDGTFQTQMTDSVGTNPQSVAAMDLNGDGKVDLVVANSNSNTVSVLLGNGNGTFQSQTTYATGTTPVSVAISDVNGDSIPDLVVANSGGNTVSVLLGNGDGTFQTQSVLSVGSAPQSVAVADLNGDGRPDIIVANSASDTISVILGTSSSSSDSGLTGPTYSVDHTHPFITSFDRVDPASQTTSATTVDFAVTFSEPVTGVDADDFTVAAGGTVATSSLTVSSTSSSVYVVAVGGITGTGTLGLDFTDAGDIHDLAGNLLVPSSNAISFQSQVTYATGSDPYSLVVADFNRDGKPDISVANQTSNTVGVLTGIGDGTLNSQTALSVGTNPVSVVAGDVNGDGKPDLVASNANDDTISVLLGNGDGTFQTQMTTSLAFDPYSIRLADLNADGKPDLIVTNSGGNYVSVLLGNGDGTFQSATSYTTGAGPASVAVADVNGDGLPDLVVANSASNTLSVLLGNGDGTFQTQTTDSVGTNPQSVAAMDLNGDGKVDLVVANSNSNTVSVLLGNGNGTFQSQTTYATGTTPVSVAISDVNGDSIPDLVVANSGGNTVSVLAGNGNGTFQTQTAHTVGSTPQSVVVTDLNGDTTADLVVANSGGNTIGVLLSSPASLTGPYFNIVAPTTPATGTWTDISDGAPVGGRVILLSNGEVMVANGSQTAWSLSPDSSGSYINGTWSQLASMQSTRLYYSSDVLPDGRVFVVGGEFSSAGAYTNKGEIYNPYGSPPSWTQIPDAPLPHVGDVPSEVLPDGRVLVGDVGDSGTLIYNPGSNTWSDGPNKVYNDSSDEETWVKLPDGSILTYDVFQSPHAERYVPSLNQWVDAGEVPVDLTAPGSELGPAFLLPDGRVFFTGASGHTALYTPPSPAAQTGIWAAGPDIPDGLFAADVPGAVLPNGNVLFAANNFINGTFPSTIAFFDFDPVSDSIGSVADSPDVAGFPTMLDLPSGQVLYNRETDYFIYTPPGSPDPSWQPAVTGIIYNGSNTYTLTGTQLNGLDEGANFGDDAEMASNYPLVRLTDSLGNVTYARTFNWSSTGVATGSTPETVEFTLPAELDPTGLMVTVVANGIASADVPLQSTVAGQNLFYYKSSRYDATGNPQTPLPFSDDNAIASDKSAYLPGSGAATFANVSSYTLGINGLMVDISGFHGTIAANDFIFRTGNNNSPSSWTTVSATATVTTRTGAGTGGSDRVEITFPDNSIQKTWLEVIVKGDDTLGGNDTNTGLGASDVFFYASAVADDGNTPDDATTFRTTANDELDASNHLATLLSNIPITNLYDYDRNGKVDAIDELASRNNPTTNLTAPKYINISGSGPFAPDVGPAAAPLVALTVAPPHSSTTSTNGGRSLASGISSLASSLPSSLPAWLQSRLQNILDSPPVAGILRTLGQENTAASRQILEAIDQFADKYNLQEDVLDGILADLGRGALSEPAGVAAGAAAPTLSPTA